jgi:UDP-2,4-diacetamido-2,4,6-trideoxy-beta-L-altropyranose hydrolase
MQNRNILFRADSSSTIGTGHIMRDLVLAKEFRWYNITFATIDLDGNINHKIKEAGYKLEILKSNSIEELNSVIERLSINMLVIDHYEINYHDEKELKRENPTLKIMVLDDNYNRHYADILLNHNIYADRKKYIGLVPNWCELRCGSKYTLIRDEFKEERRRKRVFLAIGGSDHTHINIPILRVIHKFSNLEVNIVTTTANQELDKLKKYVSDKDWATLHINSDKIAKLMRNSDFAIASPSVTLHEIMFMRLPFIAIKTANNQNEMYQYLVEKGHLTLEEMSVRDLKWIVHRMLGALDDNRAY